MLAGLVALCGCPQAPPAGPAGGKPAANQPAEKPHEHAHPSTGPHGGHLIELGKEEFHGELVDDDEAGTVTVYILDHDARDAVAIDAKELLINVRLEGKGKQYKLAASPQEGDEQGKASRFTSSDRDLVEDLHHEGADARLVVEIEGKSYTGRIEHEHGHGGDAHSGHSHKKHSHSHADSHDKMMTAQAGRNQALLTAHLAKAGNELDIYFEAAGKDQSPLALSVDSFSAQATTGSGETHELRFECAPAAERPPREISGTCSRFVAEAQWMKPADQLTVVATVQIDGKEVVIRWKNFEPAKYAHHAE